MNFSEQSLSVLKNFANINLNLQFKKGDTLQTISPEQDILAKATIGESLPRDFAIYDLNQFLGVLSAFKEPTLNFNEDSVQISSEQQKVKYVYADPSTIISPPTKKLSMPKPEVEVQLKRDQLQQIQKMASVLQVPDICFVGDKKGKISLVATDTKNSSSSSSSIELDGETEHVFNFVCKAECLKILPGDYTIKLSSKKLSHFVNDDLPVEYWILMDHTSTFGE